MLVVQFCAVRPHNRADTPHTENARVEVLVFQVFCYRDHVPVVKLMLAPVFFTTLPLALS